VGSGIRKLAAFPQFSTDGAIALTTCENVDYPELLHQLRGHLVIQRLCFILVAALLPAAAAHGQVVRFQTSVGDFDLVLNPTSNPELQGHVDNMLHYVLSGLYDDTVIHRAARNQDGSPFVLQMGEFETPGPTMPSTQDGFQKISMFAPIQGEPASHFGLSNTFGTVGLALSGNPNGSTNRDSGKSSFYINLDDNSFLDPDFTVFAEAANFTAITSIMSLPTVDLTQIPSSTNFGLSEVPILPNGNLVFIRKAFVVQNITNPKGDYNGNGRVDAADYVAWRNTQSTGVIGGGLPGDGNENGIVDDTDYNIWRTHFGAIAVSGMGAANVPEPSALALVLLLLSSCPARRFARAL
jgi:peptidyl-prolyl cis-trans isomerase A (cyclophilin A)